MQIIRQSSFMMGFSIAAWSIAAQAQTSSLPVETALRVQTNVASAFFQSVDTNADGRVSQAEFAGYIKKTTFEKMDADKDGAVTLKEWKTRDQSPESETHFTAMDKDRNGRISYSEFSDKANWKGALTDSFASLDRNRDGSLTPDEWAGHPMFLLLSVDF